MNGTDECAADRVREAIDRLRSREDQSESTYFDADSDWRSMVTSPTEDWVSCVEDDDEIWRSADEGAPLPEDGTPPPPVPPPPKIQISRDIPAESPRDKGVRDGFQASKAQEKPIRISPVKASDNSWSSFYGPPSDSVVPFPTFNARKLRSNGEVNAFAPSQKFSSDVEKESPKDSTTYFESTTMKESSFQKSPERVNSTALTKETSTAVSMSSTVMPESGRALRRIHESSELKVSKEMKESTILTFQRDRSPSPAAPYPFPKRLSPPPLHVPFVFTRSVPIVRDSDASVDTLLRQMRESKEWLELKFQEITPNMTDIGHTLEESVQLLEQHQQVLQKLQTKQSPVEELLRQADDLIGRQQPRAEVYTAMAANLGTAWSDLNAQLELRRQILELAVAFHTKAREFSEKMDDAQKLFCDIHIPSDVEKCKTLLQRHLDEKKALLEWSMQTLTAGQKLLEKVREAAGDSRGPLAGVDECCNYIECLIETLHDRRRHLESLWTQRKAALEKGLQRGLLLHDIQQVSHWLKTKGQEYGRSTALGESAASTEILLHEHLKMEQETKEIQERGIRNLSNAEQFAATSAGGEDEVKTTAYDALAEATDLVGLLDAREHNLREALEFFTLAQSALTKLDQLEVTIGSTEPPKSQQELDQYQSHLSHTIEQITEPALLKGYALINKVGQAEPSAQGLVRKVAELEQRHNYLLTLCPRVPKPEPPNPSLLNFLKKYDMMCQWLERVPENYLLSHQNMGDTFASAKDFQDGHSRLQSDFQMKRPEVEALLTLAAGMPEEEVIQKSDTLRNRWSQLSGDLDNRLKLAQRYASFHRMANQVNREMDAIENSLNAGGKNAERLSKQLDEQWLSCQQQLLQLDTSARNFKEDAKKDHSSLDVTPAVNTVDTIMEKILNRKNSLASLWDDWKKNMERSQEQQLYWDQATRDSYQISKAVSKLEKELFPILPRESGKHAEPLILYLEKHCPLEANKIQQMKKDTETQKEKVNSLSLSSELEIQKKKSLEELNCIMSKLDTWQKGYQPLVAAMLSYFRNIQQLEKVIEKQEADFRSQSSLSNTMSASHIQQLLTSHEAARSPVLELISCATSEADQVALQVAQVEPKDPANEDRSKIYQIIEGLKSRYQEAWDRHRTSLMQHLQMANFNNDLQQINQQVEELSNQLSSLKGHYGESLTSAKETSQSLSTFEKTIEDLEKRIVQFVSTAERLMNDQTGAVTVDPQHIQGELQNLQTRWSTFHRQMGDYQTLVELSLEYFRLIEEVEEWYKEGSSALATIARRSASVKTPQDADSLLQEVEQLVKPDDNKQEERLRKISQLAIQLYGGQQPPDAVQKLASQSRELTNSLSAINTQLSLKSQSLRPDQEAEKTLQVTQARPQEAIPFSSTKETVAPPEFVEPLKDIEVAEGGKCVFTCKVTGHPTPQIRWFKGGIPVNPDYRCSQDINTGWCALTIEEIFSEDSGRFTCQAVNSGGQAESHCHLTVKDGRWLQRESEAPHFVQPVTAKGPVVSGQPLTLECQVKGWPVPEVTWSHNDLPLESVPGIELTHDKTAGSCWLSIPRFTNDLQGVYTCRATNVAGQATSSTTIVPQDEFPLGQAPLFTVPLSNAMARAGQKLKLEARVSGPSVQLTWLHNNRPLTDAPQHIKTSFDGELASLIIPEAFPKDAGLYTLVARNDAGQTSCSCSVLVKGRLPLETSDSEIASDQEPIKPQVREHLSDCTVLEGNPVRLDCVIVGQPEPEVIWYHNDKPVKESNDISLLFEGDRCSLLIKEAYLEDAGTFKCVAINSGGEASSKCQLTVESLTEASDMEKSTTLSETCPKFGRMAQDVQAVEGSKVVLQCEVSGQPQPTVIWYKEGCQIESSPQYQMEFNPENGGIAKLTISQVKPSDAGTYMVLATNSVGEARSYRTLMVTPPPAQSRPLFSRYLDNMRVKQGQKVTLTCTVSGRPIPHISWQFNGRPLVEDPAAGVSIRHNSQTGEQSVTINQASAAHAGQYTIIAENATGKAVSTAFLNVEAPVSIFMKDDNIIEQKRLESTRLCRKTMVKQTVSGITDSLELHEVSAHEEKGYSKTAGEEPKEYFTSDRQERHEVEGGGRQQQQQRSILTNDIKGTTMQVASPPNQPPKFSRLLVGTSVPVGQPLVLEGIVEGFPMPSIRWTRDDGKGRTFDVVASPSRVQMSYEGRKVRLEVLKVTKADAGTYTCTASNIMGQATSSALVHVVDSTDAMTPPKFERELNSLSVRSGDRVEMHVEVTGWPNPQVLWYRDGKLVEDCPDFRLGSPKSGHHTLTIPEVFPEDAGMYRAVASNPAGETATAATLIVTESDSTDSGDNYTTYRHVSKMKEERKMYTKISMTCSPSPEPILLDDIKVSSSPPKPVAAVESRIWSPTRKEPLPAPHIIPIIREEEQKPAPAPFVPLKSVPKSPEYIYVSSQLQSKPPHAPEPIRTPTKFIPKPTSQTSTPSKGEPLSITPVWSPSKSGTHAFSQAPTWKPVQAPSPSFRSDSPSTPPPKKTFVSAADKENVLYNLAPKPFSRVDISPSPKPMDVEYCPSPPPVTMTKPPPPPPAFLKRHPAEPVSHFQPSTAVPTPGPNFPQVGRVRYLTAKFNQNLPATDL